MGGAERNARKKKQEQRAVKAVASAQRAKGDQTKVVIGVVVVVVLALVVVGGVIWSNSGSPNNDALTPPDDIKGVAATVKREGAVVVVGDDTAKATIDLYEDFLCPACGQFKKLYGEQMKQEIEKGALRVRYHPLPFLVKYSSPEGYSKDAANASLCAADQDKFWQYHESLFAKQPEEGGPGYTKQQLVQLGTDLGITAPGFKTCVDGDTHVAEAQAELDKARGTSFFKGTPTVAVGDQKIDVGDRDWLTKLVK